MENKVIKHRIGKVELHRIEFQKQLPWELFLSYCFNYLCNYYAKPKITVIE